MRDFGGVIADNAAIADICNVIQALKVGLRGGLVVEDGVYHVEGELRVAGAQSTRMEGVCRLSLYHLN